MNTVCKKNACRIAGPHKHGSATFNPGDYVYYRQNAADAIGEMPSRLTEAQFRQIIAVCRKDVQRTVNKLKRGEKVNTRFASYTAIKI